MESKILVAKCAIKACSLAKRMGLVEIRFAKCGRAGCLASPG